MKWSGTSELKGGLVEISTLSSDPDNLNHHPEYSFKVLSSSLKRFGQHKPVVVHKGIVICGNGLLEAAERLGWTHLSVSTFDGTDKEAKALAIADNKSPENSYFTDVAIDVVGELLADFTPEELGGFGALDLSDPFDLDQDEESEPSGGDEPKSPQKTIRLTNDQWEVVEKAVDTIKIELGDDFSEGRCIELICADYLSGIAAR